MSGELEWNSPGFLWLLALVPLLAGLMVLEHRRRAVLRFPLAHLMVGREPGLRARLARALPWLSLFAFALAVVALARPQARTSRVQDLTVEGIDIVLALDLSTSMDAGDFRPHNRMYVAREVLNEFIGGRVNDRIGLVVFAGAAYTQVPLTLDYGALQSVVKELKTHALEDGTAIGDALATSLNRLRESDAKSRVVVLITDGDNNAGRISPLDAASMAKALGIPIFTILVGKGGKVPFPAGQDIFGGIAWREMEIPINPELMRQISRTTGGEFYWATDREELRAGLQKVLDKMERSKLMEGGATARREEMFMPYLLLAVLALVAQLVLGATAFRRLP